MGQKETILKTRYLKEKEISDLDMFKRVAKALATDDEEERGFYDVMASYKFLPNTPCLVNAGDPNSSGQLFACFVLPVEDSMEGIFTTLRDTALVHKTGGGTGFNFGKLRPQSSTVKSTGGVASGPISFMTAYDAATETVRQGGVRRGANLGTLPITHPDVLDFISCKNDGTRLNNFNISVSVTEDFINAVKNDLDWQFSFNGENVEHKPIKARKIMNMITEQAWKNGEPGLLFIDTINEKHPLEDIIDATNPCGEQPLLPFEACCLGSINLSKFVKPDKSFDKHQFKETIQIAVQMLNNILDRNIFPLPEIKEKSLQNRKIGVGIMGYADMLIKMGLKYGSDKALQATEEIAILYEQYTENASEALAEKDGCFESWEQSAWYRNNPKKPKKMRNATVTTIAPTGTVSVIAECSSGVEPIYSPVTTINRVDSTFIEIHPLIEEELKTHQLYEKFMSDKSPDLKNYLPELAELVITAHHVTPEQHVKTQALWQKYTHNAISKTINLPNNAKQEDIYNIYMMAYDLGCKGITVYRDGSRESQVLSIQGTESNLKPVKHNELDFIIPTSRNEFGKTIGTTNKYKTACGSLYITINRDKDGNIIETFVNVSKNGICKSNIDGISRMVSVALRSGTAVDEVIDQLKGINCAACSRALAKGERLDGISCPDILAKAIQSEYDSDEIYIKKTKHGKGKKRVIKQPDKITANKCPECNGELKFEGGCSICIQCAWSKCN